MELVTLAFADCDHPDPPVEAGQNSDPPHHAKRRKINLACEQCRTRKSRCDGSKPVCSNCTRRKEQCVYQVTKAQGDTAQDYVDSLLSKIAALEDENAHLRDHKANNERDLVTKMMARSGQPAGPMGNPLSASNTLSPPRMAINKRSSNVDAMGAASDYTQIPSSGESYFGFSSTTSLMEQVLKAIGEGSTSSPTVRATSSLPIGIDNAMFEADYAGPENFSLFPRPATDFLLGRYWEKIHPLYPFVHKPTFMLSYERLWQANAPPASNNPGLGLGESGAAGPLTFVFHCGLNAMLILGLQFTDFPPAEKDSLIFQCLQKCKNLLKVDLFNEGSLAVLHTMLLLGHYFQSTTSPNKCWNIVGIACRVAQSLGLHVDGIRPTQLPPIETELRKRAWYACVILDMIIAMALGRPVMLRRRHAVPLPEPTDDEYLLHNVPQPENHLSNLMFFKETVKLYRIMREFLAELYKDGAGSGLDARKLDKTVELDCELGRLQSQLPDALHWDKPVPSNLRVREEILIQQRHVLHLRFSAARVGLHRPLFIEYCRTMHQNRTNQHSTGATNLSQRFTRCAAVLCVQTSINLVDVVDRYAGSNATCEWWYNMFFIRMAAAIFMITMTQTELLAEIGLASLDRAWGRCKNVLRDKLPANEMVLNCLQGLEMMHEQVQQHLNTTVEPSAEAVPISARYNPAEIDINADANTFGFGALDAGLLNFATDEWGFGLDEYGMPWI